MLFSFLSYFLLALDTYITKFIAPPHLSLNSSWYKGPDIWSWRRKVVDDMLDLNFLHLGSVSHTLGYLLRPQPLALFLYVLVVFILKFFIAFEWTKTFTVKI